MTVAAILTATAVSAADDARCALVHSAFQSYKALVVEANQWAVRAAFAGMATQDPATRDMLTQMGADMSARVSGEADQLRAIVAAAAAAGCGGS